MRISDWSSDVCSSDLPADFQAAGTLNAVKSQLQKLHQARMDTSKAYKYLLEDISDFEKRLNNYTVTLNPIQLKKERETEEDRRLARTNVYRVAKDRKSTRLNSSH